MEPESFAAPFALAAEIASEPGPEPLRGMAVGAASDANYTAGTGCPTLDGLDGLGAVGGGAHADTEHVVVAQMRPRTLLLAELIARTRR